jgi:eukaryotic-like serine/threonine-protein kinase
MPSDVLQPGTVLAGRFRVGRILGTGGMGAVYEIEHELTKHRRALKLLHAHASASPEIVARFLREASAAGRIGDPHIVEVFDAGTLDTGAPYVVMELLSGETLGARLAAKGRLDVPELCDLLGQTCDGVQAAHDAGIVHRDLKPDNLFVTTRDGAPFVKVLDFGVSKWSAELTGGGAITQEGAALGTPLYMAPEQVWGLPDIDARADVYALGVILYKCAAGVPPFPATSLAHLAVLIHEGNPTPLSHLRPDLPAAFHDLVGRAMARDKANRPPTARALGEELRALGAPGRAEAPTVTAPARREDTALDDTRLLVTPPLPPAGPRRVRVALAGLGIAAAVAALVVGIARHPAPPVAAPSALAPSASAPPPPLPASTAPDASASRPHAPPRRLCLDGEGGLDAGASDGVIAWCDPSGRLLARCGKGLVPMGADGICGCAPGGTSVPEAIARGCPAAPADHEEVFKRLHMAAVVQAADCFVPLVDAGRAKGGEFAATYFLTPEGEVFGARVNQSTVPDEKAQTCALDVLRAARFPPPLGEDAGRRIGFGFQLKD